MGDKKPINFNSHYGSIQQQLSGLLPDIKFDDDDDADGEEDDEVDPDKMIQPFFRGRTEDLYAKEFGDEFDLHDEQLIIEDVESTDFDQQCSREGSDMRDFSRHLSQRINHKRDISTTEVNGHLNEVETSTTTKPLFFDMTNVEEEREAREKYLPSGRLKLTFGMRGDIDLDKFLDDYEPLNRASVYNVHSDGDDSPAEESLLPQLAAVADQYTKRKSDSGRGDADEVVMDEASETDGLVKEIPATVFLDLRASEPVMGKPLEVPVPKTSASSSTSRFTSTGTSTQTDSENHQGRRGRFQVLSSSDDDSDEEVDRGLWLDKFRRAKMAAQVKQEAKKRQSQEVSTLSQKTTTTPPEKTSVSSDVSSSTSTTTQPGDSLVEIEETKPTIDTSTEVDKNNSSSAAVETEPSERVLKKIEEIKRKENTLSLRRHLGRTLNERKPKGLDHSMPVLFHEEASFEKPFLLLPSSFPSNQTKTLIINLRSSYEIVTTSRHPRSIDSGSGVSLSYISLISWLLTLSGAGSQPFQVLGLQQTTSDNIVHLYVCALISGKKKLQTFLEGHTLQAVAQPFVESLGGSASEIETQISSNLLSSFVKMADDDTFDWSGAAPPAFYWSKLKTDERCLGWCHDGEHETENSVITLTEDLFSVSDSSNVIFKLLSRIVYEGLELSGVRLLHATGGACRTMALCVRGYEAVQRVRNICGPAVGAVLAGHAPNSTWACSRFLQTVDRDLVVCFGARVSDGWSPTSDPHSARTSLLYAAQPSDLVLLISSTCPDAGWILHVAGQRGMRLVGFARLRLSASAGQAVGLAASQVAVFSRGICQLVVLRGEAAVTHAAVLLKACQDYLRETSPGSTPPHPSFLFYAMPFMPVLVDTFGIKTLHQVPEVREPLSLPEPPHDDCESLAFALLVTGDHTVILSEVLDQCAGHDLLGVKCLETLPSNHRDLLEKEFGQNLPQISGQQAPPICALVLRGIRLHQTLESIQANLGRAKNVLFAYTLASQNAYRLLASFFMPSELHSEGKRRAALQYIPVNDQTDDSLLAQLKHAAVDLENAFSWHPDNSKGLIQNLVALWRTLDQEGFTVDIFQQKSVEELNFVVKRPNAIYKLLEFVQKYSRLYIANVKRNLEDAKHLVNDVTAEIVDPNMCGLHLTYAPSKPDYDEANILLLRSPLLSRSKGKRPAVLNCLEFIGAHGFKCIGCRQFCLQTSDISTMKKHRLLNYNKETLNDEDRYLVLMFVGRLACIAVRELLRTDEKTAGIIRRQGQHVYLAESPERALECGGMFFSCIVPNESVQISE